MQKKKKKMMDVLFEDDISPGDTINPNPSFKRWENRGRSYWGPASVTQV